MLLRSASPEQAAFPLSCLSPRNLPISSSRLTLLPRTRRAGLWCRSQGPEGVGRGRPPSLAGKAPTGHGANTEKCDVTKISPRLSLPSVCPLKEGSRAFWVMRYSGTISKRKTKTGMNEGGRANDEVAQCFLLTETGRRQKYRQVRIVVQEFSWGCWEKMATAGLLDLPS